MIKQLRFLFLLPFLLSGYVYSQSIQSIQDNIHCVDDDTPFEIDLVATGVPSDAANNGHHWSVSSILPVESYTFSNQSNTGARLRINNVTTYTAVTVTVYYTNSSNSLVGGQDWESFNIQVRPPDELSPRYSSIFLLSTQAPIDLLDYFNRPANTNSTFSVDPAYAGALSGSMFDPGNISAFNTDITVTCRSYYGGSTYCYREATTIINVGDGFASLPVFVRPVDQLPICEKDNLFRLRALSGCIGNMQIRLDYDDNGSYETVTNISIPPIPAQDGFTGSYLYDFSINPSAAGANVTGIPIQVITNPPPSPYHIIYAGEACTVSNNDISGRIPITPQPELRAFGFPDYPNGVADGQDAYICAASLNELTMSGIPTGGYFNIYKNGGAAILRDGFDIGVNSPAQVRKDRYTFVPREIFEETSLGESNLNTFFRIVYHYPTTTTGACPDSIAFFLRFRQPNQTSFSVASPTPYCDGNILNLQISGNNTGDTFKWEFWDLDSNLIDQSGLLSTTTYAHQFQEPGSYFIRLQTFTDPSNLTNSCNNDILLPIQYGAKPIANFDVSGLEAGQASLFFGNDNLLQPNNEVPTDNVIRWYWHWDAPDGSIPDISEFQQETADEVSHTFNAARSTPYKVVLITEAGWGCSDTIYRYLPVFPRRTPTDISPLEEDFDTPGEATGFYNSGDYNQQSQASSWENIAPDAKNFKVIEGASPAWCTSENYNDPAYNALFNDTSGYYRNEESWIESPYFDLGQIERPAIRFDYINQTNRFFDGVNVQYALVEPGDLFGEEYWNTIGEVGEGNNWYNMELIVPQPGLTISGWSGTEDTSWHNASYVLDNLIDSLESGDYDPQTLVRFRIKFYSNNDNGPFNYDGFVFDNFRIDERTRQVVIEEFTTTAYHNANPDAVGDLDQEDEQAAVIRYFVDHNNYDNVTDANNLINTADPSSRALYYGIDQTERAVIDGTLFENTPFNFWGVSTYNRHILKISPFRIDMSLANEGGELRISRSIERIDNTTLEDRPFVVHTAVVSNSGGITNILRKMLPHAGGAYYAAHSWDGNLIVPDAYYTPVTALTGTTDFTVICFLQDAVSKEIYQAAMQTYSGALNFEDDDAIVQTRLLNDGQIPACTLYPQPSEDVTFGEFRTALFSDVRYTVRNSMGIALQEGSLSKGQKQITLDTSLLISGLYTLEFNSSTDHSTLIFVKK